MTGLFASDCSDPSTAWITWLDPGCVLQKAGADVGQTVTSALLPVWIILGFVVLLVIIIGVAPNVKHFVPHFV